MKNVIMPSWVFARENRARVSSDDIICVKLENHIPSQFWYKESYDEALWRTQGSINLWDIIDTQSEFFQDAAAKDITIHGGIVNLVYDNIHSVTMSLCTPKFPDITLQSEYFTSLDMKGMNVRSVDSTRSIWYRMDVPFANNHGMFHLSNGYAITHPCNGKVAPIFTESEAGSDIFLDETFVVLSIEIKMAAIAEAVNAITKYENPYAIFGVTFDTDKGRPRLIEYDPATYEKRRRTLETLDVATASMREVPRFN